MSLSFQWYVCNHICFIFIKNLRHLPSTSIHHPWWDVKKKSPHRAPPHHRRCLNWNVHLMWRVLQPHRIMVKTKTKLKWFALTILIRIVKAMTDYRNNRHILIHYLHRWRELLCMFTYSFQNTVKSPWSGHGMKQRIYFCTKIVFSPKNALQRDSTVHISTTAQLKHDVVWTLLRRQNIKMTTLWRRSDVVCRLAQSVKRSPCNRKVLDSIPASVNSTDE